MSNQKVLHKFTLVGVDFGKKPLTPQNCNKAFDRFLDKKNDIEVLGNLEDKWVIITPNGYSILYKHPTQNYYECVSNGVKVQVSMKKMTAEVRAWY